MIALDGLYPSILDSLPQALVIVERRIARETGRFEFRVAYANPAWERISGASVHTIIDVPFERMIYGRSPIPWIQMVESAFADGKPSHQTYYSEIVEKWLSISIALVAKDHLSLTVIDESNHYSGQLRLKEQNLRLSSLSAELAASKNNLKTKLEHIESLNNDLERLAYFDQLTRLPNRARIQATIADMIAQRADTDKRMSIALLDVDNMKNVNDFQGHDSGDELLAQLGERLKSFEKDGIIASRFGGDEFLLIIPDGESYAQTIEQAVMAQEELNVPYEIGGRKVRSTISMGIASYPDDADNMRDLLKYADMALDDAKKRGKNVISLFRTVMQDRLNSRVSLESRIFLALEDNQFELHYQPQYDIQTKQIRGFEALVRWFDPEKGNISPEEFIPIAEENRAILPLGDWILRTACETLREWQVRLDYNGVLSVNVSPLQLRNEGFLERLTKIVEDSGIVPGSLEIEITEGVLIDDFEASAERLRAIKDLGIGISLDDFGTGYSSLSYLQRLPLTALKIDKSFISNVTNDRSVEYGITDAIVSMTNTLGLDTIAEGVETSEQLSVMKRLNCKTVQGFLTGRPMPKNECERAIGCDYSVAEPASGLYTM